MFLPPHVTPLIQPMDQGVIEWLKRRYRRKYVGSLLEKSEAGFTLFEAMKSLSIKDAIYTVAAAWDEISQSTLQKAWKKVWPSLEERGRSEIDEEQLNSSAVAGPSAVKAVQTDVAETFHDLRVLQQDLQLAEIEEWLAEADISEATNEDLNDDQIVAAVQNDAAAEEENDTDEDDSLSDIVVSHSSAKDAFDIALKYIEQHPEATPMDIMWAKKWRDASAKSRLTKLKQKSITDFFV